MKHLSIILALALVAFACADNGKEDTSAKNDSTGASSSEEGGKAIVAGEENADKKKYFDIESGVIEMKNSATPGVMTLYFDRHGARQAIYSDLVMEGGMKTRAVQITADGWVYSYEESSKTGSKMKIPDEAASNPTDPSDLTPEQKKQYSYRELEPRTIVGKEATGHTFTMNGNEYSVWVWQKIPLLMELRNPAMREPVVMEVTKIDTDADVPADKFVIPADVKISEQPSMLKPSVPTPSDPAVTPGAGGTPDSAGVAKPE
jgi:hypothetical protein